MTAIARPEPKRCGRTPRHSRHTWTPHPKSADDYTCDGLAGPRSAVQLVTERPALRSMQAAGAFLADLAVSA